MAVLVRPDVPFQTRAEVAVDGPGETCEVVIDHPREIGAPIDSEHAGGREAEIVEWIQEHAIPLKTAKAEHGFGDMQRLTG